LRGVSGFGVGGLRRGGPQVGGFVGFEFGGAVEEIGDCDGD